MPIALIALSLNADRLTATLLLAMAINTGKATTARGVQRHAGAETLAPGPKTRCRIGENAQDGRLNSRKRAKYHTRTEKRAIFQGLPDASAYLGYYKLPVPFYIRHLEGFRHGRAIADL